MGHLMNEMTAKPDLVVTIKENDMSRPLGLGSCIYLGLFGLPVILPLRTVELCFCMNNRQNQTALERKTAVLVAACFFRVGFCHI